MRLFHKLIRPGNSLITPGNVLTYNFIEYAGTIKNLLKELSEIDILETVLFVHLFDDEFAIQVAGYSPSCVLCTQVEALYESFVLSLIIGAMPYALGVFIEEGIGFIANEHTNGSRPWVVLTAAIRVKAYVVECSHHPP
jgi:hypothetical protein